VQDACSGSDSRTGILVQGTPASTVDAAGAAAAGSLGKRCARTLLDARTDRRTLTHVDRRWSSWNRWPPTGTAKLCGRRCDAQLTASRMRAHFGRGRHAVGCAHRSHRSPDPRALHHMREAAECFRRRTSSREEPERGHLPGCEFCAEPCPRRAGRGRISLSVRTGRGPEVCSGVPPLAKERAARQIRRTCRAPQPGAWDAERVGDANSTLTITSLTFQITRRAPIVVVMERASERRLQLPRNESPERRATNRFPMTLEIRYVVRCAPAETGSGRTIDLSSSGLSLTADRPLLIGPELDVSIDWPVLLGGGVQLQLIMSGTVVRTNGS